jgi:hypothetical protein
VSCFNTVQVRKNSAITGLLRERVAIKGTVLADSDYDEEIESGDRLHGDTK